MDSTDGVQRGMEVKDTGKDISVPVGDATLGRVFNVLGETIDLDEKIDDSVRRDPIHRQAPGFDELSTKVEILETGIKVVDLLAPYIKGGKIGLFGGAGVGKTVLIKNLSIISLKSMVVFQYSPVLVNVHVKVTTFTMK